MIPLTFREGKPFIGKYEVEINPVFMNVAANYLVEEGTKTTPPLEFLITKVIEELKSKGIDILQSANCCRVIYSIKEVHKDMRVADGYVPSSSQIAFFFDFYHARFKDEKE
jgi:hypothetical protein